MSENKAECPAKSQNCPLSQWIPCWFSWSGYESFYQNSYYRLLINPYELNSTGNDSFTETAISLAEWKQDNVFPIHLKFRALGVFFGTLVALKSLLISEPEA